MTDTLLVINDYQTNPALRNDGWRRTGMYKSDSRELVNRSLDHLASLPKNWDHQGAAEIDPRIIAAAKTLVDGLQEDIIGTPSVAPISSGSLQFDWQVEDRSLEIEFESAEVARFLKWAPTLGIEEEESFNLDGSEKVNELLFWLIGSSYVQ